MAGIVHIELPGHARTAGGKDTGQRVAQHAAPGVAHVHGTGGIGGNKLHHDLLSLVGVAGAVVRSLSRHRVHYAGVPVSLRRKLRNPGPAISAEVK